MKFKIHKSLVCSALLLLAACSNYVDEYEDEWKDAFDNENASVDPSDPEGLDISSSSNADKPVKLSSSSAAVKPGSSEAKSTSSSSVTESSSSIAASSVTETSSSSEQPSSSSAITSSAAQNSSGSVASSSSAQSSNSQTSSSSVASSSSVTSSASLSFHWDVNDNHINTNLGDGGNWNFSDASNIVKRPSQDSCKGLCALVFYHDPNPDILIAYESIGFNIDKNNGGTSHDVSSWGGICITYYSDHNAKLSIAPKTQYFDDDLPYFVLESISNGKATTKVIPWDLFRRTTYYDAAEVSKNLKSVSITFEGKPGEKHFFNIYEIGSVGKCDGTNNSSRPVFNTDSLYINYIKPSWRHLEPNWKDLDPGLEYGIITDTRNDTRIEYKTIEIGGQAGKQIWMAENLNFDMGNNLSACFNDDSEKCAEYGRLYSAEALQQYICPEGYRMPTEDDFNALKKFASMGHSADFALALKSCNDWPDDDFDWCNATGFSAFPVGYFETDWTAEKEGVRYWTSSKNSSNGTVYYDVTKGRDTFIDRGTNFERLIKYSVRCIKE